MTPHLISLSCALLSASLAFSSSLPMPLSMANTVASRKCRRVVGSVYLAGK